MSQSAVQKFIDATRALFAVESDSAKRWQKMPPLLEELLANPALKEQSKTWPDCSQGSERAENLLFYEDPDYKFVINGLIKAPKTRTQIHDHAHHWTLYGVLDGTETVERYERVDDRSLRHRTGDVHRHFALDVSELTKMKGQLDPHH